MCGRFAVTLKPNDLAEFFATAHELEFPARYNIAPTQPIVAIWEEAGRRTARLARWGLVPGWVKDPREFSLIVNARAESMADKPSFRTALRHQRCVVPASGYYEWHTGPDRKKTPYYITRADGDPMALAGLYSTWMGPNGEEIDTAALITVAANGDLDHIHDRMPAILPPESIDDWLNTRDVDAREAHRMAVPLPLGTTKFERVSTRVNSNKYDDPGLIEPVAEEVVEAKPEKSAEPPAQLDLF
jgi:putative SOS response-associated peptidase YedK